MRDIVGRGAGQLFWGTLLIVLDFRLENFDLINDVIGACFVVSGLSLLVKLPVPAAVERFRPAHTLAIASLVLATCLEALVLADEELALPVGILHGIVSMVGVLLLIDGFRRLAAARAHTGLAETWGLTWILMVALGIFPLGLIAGVGLTAWSAGEREAMNYGAPLVIFPVLLTFVPLIHLLVSLSRTRRMAADLDEVPTESAPALPS